MTSGAHAHTKSPAAPHPALRLRLKPKAPATGYVDGAWWPRSRDLTTELAALARVLAVRLGRIERVAYALSMWDTAPRRFELDGFWIRLEGFVYQDQNIIHVTGSNHGRISLLVVPPEMTDPAGHEALMTAGHEATPTDPRTSSPRPPSQHRGRPPNTP